PGHILEPHAREHAVHLFIHFAGPRKQVKKWISDFTRSFVTSARRQLSDSEERKRNCISGRHFGGFYLSAAGYRKLGFNPDQFVESQGAGSPNTFFKDGMRKKGGELNDPPISSWDKGFRDQPIHAMVLLAAEAWSHIHGVQAHVEKTLCGIGAILVRQHGAVLLNKDGKGVEHFGYRDGISQPLYYQSDVQEQ